MDLIAAVPVAVEVRGLSLAEASGRGRLNLSGPASGLVRACSLHPTRTVGPDGCPRCWEIHLARAVR